MKPLYYTLAAEGSSDDMLLPLITWALKERLGQGTAVNPQWRWHSRGIGERIRLAVTEYGETDLLVVHADADDRDGLDKRVSEIRQAVDLLDGEGVELPTHICLIPVKESEAWLLFDESAIRSAAGNPNGKVKLGLPVRHFDRISDPKQILNDAVMTASELPKRRLNSLQTRFRPVQVADRIEDFSPLRKLEAFRVFENEIASFVEQWRTTAEE
jgi:hypothetical protein